MNFLIDGYNLMDALVMLPKKHLQHLPRARSLRSERARFLAWLADQVRDRPVTVCVLFDGRRDQPDQTSKEQEYRGLHFRFVTRQTVDDEIEELLAAEPNPQSLTVVSSDTRLRMAGQRRRARVMTCQEFLDWLSSQARNKSETRNNPGRASSSDRPPPSAEKPERVQSGAEDDLLEIFSRPKPRKS